jgi:predicted KAP-like P-loop ATPase
MSSNIKIITDEPTLDDALDFKHYARTLADIILNSTPRFSVGIFGGWGTGKTSLMLMIKEILEDSPQVVTVWFDAWRYEREQNLAVIPFLRTIKLTLDASEKSRDGKWEGVKKGIVRSAIAFIKSSKVTYGVPGVATAESDFGSVADSLKGDGYISDDRNIVYYYVTQFLERALTQLRQESKDHRLVVFIDDLDRCSPERALEVLESIKSFFDIEGIIYVVGMDSKTINSIVKRKFGQDSAILGLDYLQKIVQLPFQIPTWKEADIYDSIIKIIQRGLAGSELIDQFTNTRNTKLIVKAVELNPREVKRFINTIILVRSVFDKPIDELIVVQALNFRNDWNKFLELITPDEARNRFLKVYEELRNQDNTVSSEEELAKFCKERNIPFKIKEDYEIYQEVFKHGNALTSFLDVGALQNLQNIHHMEEHRRVLAAARVRRVEEDKEAIERDIKSREEHEAQMNLLKQGKVKEFNAQRSAWAVYPGAIDLSGVDLSGVDFSRAYFWSTDLSGANLSRANLSFVTSFEGLKCDKTNFSGATITNNKLVKYLKAHGAVNVPTAVDAKKGFPKYSEM